MSKAAFAGLKGVQEMRFVLCQTGKAGGLLKTTTSSAEWGTTYVRVDAHTDARTLM